MAQSVVKRDQHILNGATPHASFELLDNAENTSKTIQITGLTAQSTEDSIRNYFENERRSGGGEVEAVTFRPEENVALVTFKDVEGEFFQSNGGKCGAHAKCELGVRAEGQKN